MNHQHLPVIILFFLNCERADFSGISLKLLYQLEYPRSSQRSQAQIQLSSHTQHHTCMHVVLLYTRVLLEYAYAYCVSTTSTHNNRVGVGVEYELVCIILLQSMYQIVCKCILCIRHYTSLVCICHLRARNVILLYSHTSQYINNILSLYFITTLVEQLKYACSSTNTTLVEWLYF